MFESQFLFHFHILHIKIISAESFFYCFHCHRYIKHSLDLVLIFIDNCSRYLTKSFWFRANDYLWSCLTNVEPFHLISHTRTLTHWNILYVFLIRFVPFSHVILAHGFCLFHLYIILYLLSCLFFMVKSFSLCLVLVFSRDFLFTKLREKNFTFKKML